MLGCGDLPSWTHSNATQQSQAQKSQGRVTLRNQKPGPHSHPAQELLLYLPQPSYPRLTGRHCLPSTTIPPTPEPAEISSVARLPWHTNKQVLGTLWDCRIWKNGPNGKWWWVLLELVKVVSYQLLPPF